MDKAINRNTSMNLKESKSVTDELLRVGKVSLEVESTWDLNGLKSDLKRAGANLTVVKE